MDLFYEANGFYGRVNFRDGRILNETVDIYNMHSRAMYSFVNKNIYF